jgi:hypothetical protein
MVARPRRSSIRATGSTTAFGDALPHSGAATGKSEPPVSALRRSGQSRCRVLR